MKENPDIRVTKQRRIILEELVKMHTHPAADELYEKVRKRLPRISLGTVYRNLELLSRLGMVRKVGVSGSQMRFDGDTSPHNHIRCIRCGRVDDLDVDHRMKDCSREIRRKTGYEMIESRVEILGLCPDCRKNERQDSGNRRIAPKIGPRR